MYPPYHYYSQVPRYPHAPPGTGTYPDTVHFGGRVFSSWIEYDTNGRAYHVRRKPVLPSFRQIVAEAFRDIRSNYSTANRPALAIPPTPNPTQDKATAVLQSSIENPASTNKPKSNLKNSQSFTPQAPQQQRPAMASDNRASARQQTPTQAPAAYPQDQSSFYVFPFVPPFQGFPQQHHLNQNTARQEDNPTQANLGALTHYSSPHPRMYPFVPSGTQPVPHSMLPTAIPGVPPGQGAFTPENHPSQPLMTNFPPNVNHITSTNGLMYGMPPYQTPSKAKCSACGRERSSKYQWKHRKSQGKAMELNICRRCRESGTDSEYESDDSEYQEDRTRRSRNRGHTRGRSFRTRSTARSSSRPSLRDDFDFYAYQSIDDSNSDMEESEDGQRKRHRKMRGKGRRASAGLDRARDSRTHRSISRPRHVVFVEPPRGRLDLHSDDEEVEARYVDRHASGPVVVSRPSTPAVRPQSLFQLDNDLRTPIVIERREYYEEPWPSRHFARSSSKLGPRQSHPHDSEPFQDPKYGVETYVLERGGQYHEKGTDDISRRHRLRGTSRSRSRSHFSIDEGAESGSQERVLHRVPSPVRSRRRSPTTARSHNSKGPSEVEETVDRSRDRRSDQRRPSSDARGGGQRRASPPPDDYDWYDKDGMRIRVREIC